MSAPLALDWTEIKTLSLAIGCREAIRRMGLEKHKNAIMQRSAREGWFEHRHAARESLTPAGKAKTLAIASGLQVSDVSNRVSAVDVLSEMKEKTRAAFGNAALRVAEKAQQTDVDELLADADSYSKWVGNADKLHGYSGKQDQQHNQPVINVNLLCVAPQSHEDARGDLGGPVVMEDSGDQHGQP